MFWGKFGEARSHLKKIAELPDPFWAKTCERAADMLDHAELFYLPNAQNIVEGRNYDDDFKAVMRLPYDVAAVISECDIRGADGLVIAQTWAISIGLNLQSDLAARWVGAKGEQDCWAVGSILLNRETKIWSPLPGFALVEHPPGEPGVQFGLALPDGMPSEWGRMESKEDRAKLINEFRSDVDRLQNLCLMLSLHNVKGADVAAPPKVNRSREKKGVAPLRGYHVLEVGGEVWDGVNRGTGDGDGFRSHFRRGHIRRLDEQRRVWVSSSFIHGRKPGFVDKEYSVGAPTGVA